MLLFCHRYCRLFRDEKRAPPPPNTTTTTATSQHIFLPIYRLKGHRRRRPVGKRQRDIIRSLEYNFSLQTHTHTHIYKYKYSKRNTLYLEYSTVERKKKPIYL